MEFSPISCFRLLRSFRYLLFGVLFFGSFIVLWGDLFVLFIALFVVWADS